MPGSNPLESMLRSRNFAPFVRQVVRVLGGEEAVARLPEDGVINQVFGQLLQEAVAQNRGIDWAVQRGIELHEQWEKDRQLGSARGI